jgi:hypothetical protein
MVWTAPSFETIRMDAEIGSYQEDSDPERGPAIVTGTDAAEGREAP